MKQVIDVAKTSAQIKWIWVEHVCRIPKSKAPGERKIGALERKGKAGGRTLRDRMAGGNLVGSLRIGEETRTKENENERRRRSLPSSGVVPTCYNHLNKGKIK